MKKTENDIFRSAVKRMKKEVLKATFKEADRMNALKEAMSYSRDDADPRYSGGPGKDDDYASDFAGIPGASRGEGEEDNETKMSMDKGDPLEDPEVEGEEGYSAVGEKHPGPDSGTTEVPHGEDLFEGHEDEREEHDHDKDAAKDDWDHIIKLAKDAHEDHVRRDDGEEGEEDRDRHRDAAEDDWAHIHALAKDAGMDKEDEDHLREQMMEPAAEEIGGTTLRQALENSQMDKTTGPGNISIYPVIKVSDNQFLQLRQNTRQDGNNVVLTGYSVDFSTAPPSGGHLRATGQIASVEGMNDARVIDQAIESIESDAAKNKGPYGTEPIQADSPVEVLEASEEPQPSGFSETLHEMIEKQILATLKKGGE